MRTSHSLLLQVHHILSLLMLVSIRWLKHGPRRNDPLEDAGCYRVVYDTDPQVRSTSGASGVYEVIHLSTIVCRHHLVPNFTEKGSFYISNSSPIKGI
jgi:hypothetical protein